MTTWRVVRLLAVLLAAASLWACYRTTRVPGGEARRLRDLIHEPKVTLRSEEREIEVDRATEVTIDVADGTTHAVAPGLCAYSDSAMKLGRADDPTARTVRFGDITTVGVREFSIGRTLALALPLGLGALLVGAVAALLCVAGAC